MGGVHYDAAAADHQIDLSAVNRNRQLGEQTLLEAATDGESNVYLHRRLPSGQREVARYSNESGNPAMYFNVRSRQFIHPRDSTAEPKDLTNYDQITLDPSQAAAQVRQERRAIAYDDMGVVERKLDDFRSSRLTRTEEHQIMPDTSEFAKLDMQNNLASTSQLHDWAQKIPAPRLTDKYRNARTSPTDGSISFLNASETKLTHLQPQKPNLVFIKSKGIFVEPRFVLDAGDVSSGFRWSEDTVPGYIDRPRFNNVSLKGGTQTFRNFTSIQSFDVPRPELLQRAEDNNRTRLMYKGLEDQLETPPPQNLLDSWAESVPIDANTRMHTNGKVYRLKHQGSRTWLQRIEANHDMKDYFPNQRRVYSLQEGEFVPDLALSTDVKTRIGQGVYSDTPIKTDWRWPMATANDGSWQSMPVRRLPSHDLVARNSKITKMVRTSVPDRSYRSAVTNWKKLKEPAVEGGRIPTDAAVIRRIRRMRVFDPEQQEVLIAGGLSHTRGGNQYYPTDLNGHTFSRLTPAGDDGWNLATWRNRAPKTGDVFHHLPDSLDARVGFYRRHSYYFKTPTPSI